MRQEHHIHPEEIISPDLLSEIVLICTVMTLVGFLLALAITLHG
jgi:hypothetical protein